jgi:hypothetical protein
MLWFVVVGVRERKEFASDQFSILLSYGGKKQVTRLVMKLTCMLCEVLA